MLNSGHESNRPVQIRVAAAQLLADVRRGIPKCLQRQSAPLAGDISHRRCGGVGNATQRTRAARRRAVCAAVHFVFHGRRIFCRPLQQARRDRRRQVRRNRPDGFCAGRPVAQQHSRPVQIRPAAGIAAGKKVVVGQRNVRLRNICRDYCRNHFCRNAV